MSTTQKRTVVEIRLAAEQPVHEVVHVAPGRRCPTSGKLAVPISQHDCPTQRAWDGARPPSEVEHLSCCAHHEAGDRTVAHQAFGGDARGGPFSASPDRQFCISRMRAIARVTEQISLGADHLAMAFAAAVKAFSTLRNAPQRPEQE